MHPKENISEVNPRPDVAGHVGIRQLIYTVQESEYFSVIFQKTDNRFVQSGQCLVRLITSGVMGTAAVEHITASVSTLVYGNPLAVGETEYAYHQRTLPVVL